MHTDNKKKYILVLGEDPTQILDDTKITPGALYSVTFSKSQRKFCLSLHYSGCNSFLFVNTTKIHQFKAKHCGIKPYLLHLRNISKYFTANNMKKRKKKQNGLNGYVYDMDMFPLIIRLLIQFTMLVTPCLPSLNVVINLVAKKSLRFNTNTTFRSVGGEVDIFLTKFLLRY